MNSGFQTWMKNTQSNKCKTCLYLALCIPKDELTLVINLTSQVKRCKIELSILAYMPDGFKRCMSLCLDCIFLLIWGTGVMQCCILFLSWLKRNHLSLLKNSGKNLNGYFTMRSFILEVIKKILLT